MFADKKKPLFIEVKDEDLTVRYGQEENIDIAALTIPKTKAVEVSDILVRNGIKAIWNFAHTDLNLPDEVIVENVHLSESLMRLSYTIANEGR